MNNLCSAESGGIREYASRARDQHKLLGLTVTTSQERKKYDQV